MVGELLPALVTAGVGVVLLVIVVLTAMGPVRRFTRARGAFRADVRAGTAALRAAASGRRRPRRPPTADEMA